MLALAHGLRDAGTGQRLRQLRDLGVLEAQNAADMIVAYQFLLSLESRIRIVADLPEDRLPDDPRPLAHRLGYIDTGVMKAEESLREEYEYHTAVAARAFRKTVAELTADS